MAEKIPVKAIYTQSDVTGLGEFTPTDTIQVVNIPFSSPGSIGIVTPVPVLVNTLERLVAPVTTLDIASGVVTVTQSVHTVDTESSAATDNLDTILGFTNEQLLLIRANHTDRSIVVTETGNILTGGSDITLDGTNKYILFLYDSVLTKWVVVGGSGSAPAGIDVIGMQVFS